MSTISAVSPDRLGVPVPAPLPTRFLGRQPIFDARMHLFGYELLFRSGLENACSGDPETATRQVLDNYLLLALDSGAGTNFINCTRDVLVKKLATLLPPKSTVLEILEHVSPDAEVLEACRGLRQLGYRFALDDFVPNPARLPFLEVADFIKVDFRSSCEAERREIYKTARRGRVKFIAEKVESEEEVKQARAEGNELFQGYFFSKPIIVSHSNIPPSKLANVRLLLALHRSPLDMGQIEQLVMVETSLCYRLLRLVNSALFGLAKEIRSVRGALLMVGEEEFRKLVTVAMAGVLAEDQPHALISLALQRARFCELLAAAVNENASEQYLMGMLSLVDTMLHKPMSQVVQLLPLREEVKAALLGEVSSLSAPLNLIRHYEAGEWQRCTDYQLTFGISEARMAQLYLDSIRWTHQILRSTSPAPELSSRENSKLPGGQR